MVFSLSFYTFAAKRIYNIGIYGNTVQKAPNVYFPSEDGYHKGNNITFTGSSLIQILNADADLSRRVLSYTMEGLSFREFLHFYKGIQLPKYSLEEILANADNICAEVNAKCRPVKMFEEYLRVGYYPFFEWK